ncbi:MAG: NUDIX domain-containing protein, partial [bacterium]|nr:NUDIX domain-containing protein [bacterium]
LRELQEETGLSAYIYDDFNESLDYFFIEQGSRIHKTVYYLIAETTEKRVVLSHEHIGFIWLPYEQALEILTYDNAKHILRKAHDVIQSIKKQ